MSTTLTNLLTQTRDYLDESTADRWTDAELTRYINQGLRQVQSQIESANSDYFIRVEVATAGAGTYELALPTDIWGCKIRTLQHYPSSTVATGMAYRVEPVPMENVYKYLHISGIRLARVYPLGAASRGPVAPVDEKVPYLHQNSFHTYTTATARERKRTSPESIPRCQAWKPRSHWLISGLAGIHGLDVPPDPGMIKPHLRTMSPPIHIQPQHARD